MKFHTSFASAEFIIDFPENENNTIKKTYVHIHSHSEKKSNDDDDERSIENHKEANLKPGTGST